MYTSHFYYINTMLIYKFTASLKFSYNVHADLLMKLLQCAFSQSKTFK